MMILSFGRAVFWELDNMFPSGWMVTSMMTVMILGTTKTTTTTTTTRMIMMNFAQVLDYICDILYIVDIVVRMHEGKT